MSTIDPVKRERDPAYAERRRTVRLALTLAAAVVCGYGISIYADFPGTRISFGAEEPWASVKALVLMAGLVATLLLIGVVVRLPAPQGVRGEQIFVLALALLAVTAGLFVGSFLPSSFEEFTPADLSDKRVGVREVCAFLVVVAGFLVLLAEFRTRRRLRTMHLRETGRRVSAEVTEVHDTGVTRNTGPWVRLTVSFTDHGGTKRFVRRHMTVNRFAGPEVGDKVRLWYDPNDPSDEKKIVIGDDGSVRAE